MSVAERQPFSEPYNKLNSFTYGLYINNNNNNVLINSDTYRSLFITKSVLNVPTTPTYILRRAYEVGRYMYSHL